ncbi:hypothetical protein NKR17_20090 [Priestia flexa]|uniref:hypothetical protein n=1 Tax=Priestia flexa TaxID=86664 RepID=UPI00203CE0C1|nr:hypothetical protein [Priestia flexa]MCM3068567.1 hypothetical protein [Priestia flexa]MCP1191333.1 hypothetical protein [Priestia flexa]
MEKQHKSTVKSLIAKNGYWTGFLVASKVNPAHIEGCCNLGFKVTVSTIEQLEKTVERFAYYNCNSELGNRVSLYEK